MDYLGTAKAIFAASFAQQATRFFTVNWVEGFNKDFQPFCGL